MFKLLKIAPVVWMVWRWYRRKNTGAHAAGGQARRY